MDWLTLNLCSKTDLTRERLSSSWNSPLRSRKEPSSRRVTPTRRRLPETEGCNKKYNKGGLSKQLLLQTMEVRIIYFPELEPQPHSWLVAILGLPCSWSHCYFTACCVATSFLHHCSFKAISLLQSWLFDCSIKAMPLLHFQGCFWLKSSFVHC